MAKMANSQLHERSHGPPLSTVCKCLRSLTCLRFWDAPHCWMRPFPPSPPSPANLWGSFTACRWVWCRAAACSGLEDKLGLCQQA